MSQRLSPVMAGRTVLVTAQRRSEDMAEAFRRRGATVRCVPAMSIIEHADDERLLTDTRALITTPPDVLVVTTGSGFRGWVEAADVADISEELLTALTDVRILARGTKAKGALLAHGLTPHLVAESETTEEITEHLLTTGVAGTRVAVQHHGRGADGLDEALTAAGATVAPFVVYRQGPAPDPEALAESVRDVADGGVDVVLFTSAPAASSWLAAADAAGVTEQVLGRGDSGDLLLAAVGPVTAAPLRARGANPLVPDRSRMGALVRAVIDHCARAPAADG